MSIALPESYNENHRNHSATRVRATSHDAFQPRILFVSSSKGNGGADRHAVELAAGLQERGHEVLFACRGDEFTMALCETIGVTTTPFDLSNGSDVRAVLRLARVIHDHSTDIVHVHARRDFLTAALAVMLSRARPKHNDARRPRLVFHMHLIRTIGVPLRISGKFFAANVDAIIAVSRTVAKFLQSAHGLTDGIVRTVYNGVELASYEVAGSAKARDWKTQSRREWGVPEDATVIGMIGRLGQKGQANLLAVAERLVRRFHNLHFVFVGPERDPGDRERLLLWARQQHVAGHIIVPGACEDIPRAMAGFDVLAHLPLDEAFGLVLVEAMASGIPIVAAAIGGCREVITDGETGLLVPARNQEELISAISRLVDPQHGAQMRSRLGENGRRAATRFSRDVQLDNLQSLYRELCGVSA